MSDSPDFEQLHRDSHQRLVLQAIALTGDPSAATAGVRDAFIAASRSWDRVSRLANPEEWIRSRAWSMAHRRHLARPWHRDQEITTDQATVLRGLQQLPDNQRRSLILHHLVGLPLRDISRELGTTEAQSAQLLNEANTAYVRTVDVTSTGILDSLMRLEQLASGVPGPDPAQLRQIGQRHRIAYIAVGSIAALAVFLGAGFLVSTGHAGPVLGSPDDARPVTQSMLLSEQQLSPLAGPQPWTITSTGDNTKGSGLNSICQAERFADSAGLGTFVRKFEFPGVPLRTLVQTVEISKDPARAKKAYETTLQWFAGCSAPRVRLQQAWQVSGLGDRAELLSFVVPEESGLRHLMVGLTQNHSLTVSTVEETINADSASPELTTQILTQAAKRLCRSSASANKCTFTPTIQVANPPSSGETPGTLSVVDLPTISNLAHPWMGSDLLPGEPNVASTPCDNTSFTGSGAKKANTRGYLVPQSGLPARFGITETVAEYPDQAATRRVFNQVTAKMAACATDLLGTKVSQAKVQKQTPTSKNYGLWRVESQINDKQETVQWWMGIIRVGNYLAQISFAPVAPHDLTQAQFSNLVERAGERLDEVAVANLPSQTPTPKPEPGPTQKG